MEDMFVWILVLAGAIIGLLATFLVASERELKKKRGEAEELAARINVAESAHGESHQPQIRNELRASQLENAEVRKSNQKLEEELALAKSQLDIGRGQLEESRNEHEDVTARHVEFEREIANLRDELEQSRRKVLALESNQARYGDLESRESLMKEQQQQLEREIAELNNQLIASRDSLRELETTRAQLQQSETLRQQFVNDNQRLQQEIAAWQERLADSEEQRRRLSTVRHHLDSLKTKRSALSESHRQLEEELDALARFADTSEGIHPAASPLINLETGSISNSQDNFRSELNGSAARLEASVPFNASTTSPAPEIANAPGPKKRRFGIFPAVVALALGGAVGNLLG